MPLPPFVISASVLLCQNALTEPDGVISAIRIVDIFFVSEKPADAPENLLPLVQAYACVILKTVPHYTEEHVIQLKLINTIGEVSNLGEPITLPFAAKPGMQDVPGGISINAQLNIGVKRLGTCYVCVHLDGEEIARTPFTLLKLDKPGETTS
jgi:hypothetical protein